MNRENPSVYCSGCNCFTDSCTCNGTNPEYPWCLQPDFYCMDCVRANRRPLFRDTCSCGHKKDDGSKL